MRVADTVVAWLVLVLGVMHCAFTRKAYPQFTMATLWFLSAGMLMILLAAVNLLRIRYVAVAPGVRAVCIVANVLVLAWAAGFGAVLPLAQNPQVIASITLIALLTIFSILRRTARV